MTFFFKSKPIQTMHGISLNNNQALALGIWFRCSNSVQRDWKCQAGSEALVAPLPLCLCLLFHQLASVCQVGIFIHFSYWCHPHRTTSAPFLSHPHRTRTWAKLLRTASNLGISAWKCFDLPGCLVPVCSSIHVALVCVCLYK